MKSGIYTITNLIDGKIYVGYASCISNRLRTHRYNLILNKHGNIHLQRAVNKYGIDSFDFSELEYCEKQYLCSQENYWCNLLNTHNDKFGYNIEPTTPNCKCGRSQSTIEKMRIASTGKKYSKETVEKRAIQVRRKIIQYDLQENFICEYKSIAEAEEVTGICRANISSVLRNITRHAGKFLWKYKNPDIINKNLKANKKYTAKIDRSVYQYTLKGQFLKEYINIREASKSTGIQENTLGQIASGKVKNPKKFMWKYKRNITDVIQN